MLEVCIFFPCATYALCPRYLHRYSTFHFVCLSVISTETKLLRYVDEEERDAMELEVIRLVEKITLFLTKRRFMNSK